MERVEYGGWANCYRLHNDVVELIVTADVGPRIIRFGFVDRIRPDSSPGYRAGALEAFEIGPPRPIPQTQTMAFGLT